MANVALPTSSDRPPARPAAWRAPRRKLATYVMSVSLLAIVVMLRSWLTPTLGDQALYLFLIPPVLVAGVVGGLGPGILTTVLSLVTHLYVTGGSGNLHPGAPLFAA